MLICVQPAFFALCFFGYKYCTGCTRVSIEDLTPSKYILEDLEFLESSTIEPPSAFRKPSNVSHNPYMPELGNQDEVHMMSAISGKRPARQSVMSADMMDQMEQLRAMEAEKRRVEDILKRRPIRWQGGLWAAIWSFIMVTDEK
jgi:amino acid transporter